MASKFKFDRADHPGQRQLLVDVSTIIKADVRTGIQRVVRALLGELIAAKVPEFVVQPVFASRNHGYCKALLLPDGQVVNASRSASGLLPVTVRKGDKFLGLDLAAQTLPAVEAQLAGWRRNGVSINLLVYDLLPIIHPDWFSPKLVRHFQRWLGVLARQTDRCICISATVAASVRDELARRYPDSRPSIVSIPLGANLNASFPSVGLPADIVELRHWMQSHRAVLSVGTIEPRKGHDRVLDAMEQIWHSDPEGDVALVVVGRPGWRTEHLQQRIASHAELGKRLIWLDGASDELLSELYGNSAGLIAASRQEGFGLPLIEAIANGAPVLARDLPVFREVGGSLFDYFEDDAPAALAARLRNWLIHSRRPSRGEMDALPDWTVSAASLLAHLEVPVTSNGTTR